MNKPTSLLMNLPLEITANILARLPSRTIVSCKCICKQWRKLLSSSEFVKLHLSVSTPDQLVLQITDQYGTNLCKVIEHEGIFQLQLHGLGYNVVTKFDPKAYISSPADYVIEMEGSVDGLLFLKYSSKIDDVIYLCNPTTREYISLPRLARISEYANFTNYGFGVSSITHKYKIIYLFQKCPHNVRQFEWSENYRCEFYEYLVYTLGPGSWRSIPRNSPFEQVHLSFGMFLNGNLHGLVQIYYSESDMLISCFDLEDESFKPFPPPPSLLQIAWAGIYNTLGVLDGCLCICDSICSTNDGTTVFWTMKEYGVKESWTRQFVFVGTQIISFMFDVVHPIKSYKNGDILLSWQDRKVFYYRNKTKTSHTVNLFDQNFDTGGSFKAMLHKSSFLSLESFDGENAISFYPLSGNCSKAASYGVE